MNVNKRPRTGRLAHAPRCRGRSGRSLLFPGRSRLEPAPFHLPAGGVGCDPRQGDRHSAVDVKRGGYVVTTRTGQRLNGMDVDELREDIDSVTVDAAQADRYPTVLAPWLGSTRAEVVSTLGRPPVRMGGGDGPSVMEMFLLAPPGK